MDRPFVLDQADECLSERFEPLGRVQKTEVDQEQIGIRDAELAAPSSPLLLGQRPGWNIAADRNRVQRTFTPAKGSPGAALSSRHPGQVIRVRHDNGISPGRKRVRRRVAGSPELGEDVGLLEVVKSHYDPRPGRSEAQDPRKEVYPKAH